jgi:hypothetical protein
VVLHRRRRHARARRPAWFPGRAQVRHLRRGDGGALDGENLIIFEVNGWHNVVHIASGLFLLALSGRHATARTAALAFGAIYGVVTIIGLVDGKDVLGLFPVNPADNILHILLTAAAFAAALAPWREGARRHETAAAR